MSATFDKEPAGKLMEALKETVKVERSFNPRIAKLLQNIDEDRLAQLLGIGNEIDSSAEKRAERKQHPLARYFAENSPFDGLSDKIVRATRDFRKGMGERLSDKLDSKL